MIENIKPVDALQVADLQNYPVWQYTNRDPSDETAVRPVKKIPVANLDGKIVGTQVQLRNGEHVWALIGNLDSANPEFAEHFITLSIERNGSWFHLARYHDFNYAESGPEALAHFLGLHLNEVFPISYDVRKYVKGNPATLAGAIRREPRKKLSRAEIIALAVP
jgi:hypothetical protein